MNYRNLNTGLEKYHMQYMTPVNLKTHFYVQLTTKMPFYFYVKEKNDHLKWAKNYAKFKNAELC